MTEHEEAALVLSLERETARLDDAAIGRLIMLGERLEAYAANAASFPHGTAQSDAVWLEMSILNEQIAEILPAGAYAGTGPRVNAVLAANGAGDSLRAWALIARYESEPLDDESLALLVQYGREADDNYAASRQGGSVSFVTVAETS